MHKDSKLGVMTNVGKNRRDRRDNKVITILYDRFLFTEMYSHNIWRKLKLRMKNDVPNIPNYPHISDPNLL